VDVIWLYYDDKQLGNKAGFASRSVKNDDVDSLVPDVLSKGGSVEGLHVFVYRRFLQISGLHSLLQDRLADLVRIAIQSGCCERADCEVEPCDA